MDMTNGPSWLPQNKGTQSPVDSIDRTNTGYALQYAAIGWHVIPLHTVNNGVCTCGNTECSSPGKHPRTRNGLHDASIDEGKIRSWFERWPDANIGIVTGRMSGITVIDVDLKDGGLETWEQLKENNPRLPDTPMAITGSGGQHWVFSYIDGWGNRTGIRPGIDVRSDGGYIVVEPSQHISGTAYAWDSESDPLEGCKPQPAPDWIKSLQGPQLMGQPGNLNFDATRVRLPHDGSQVMPGQRNNSLASLVGQWIHEGMTRGQCLDRAHQWNSDNPAPLNSFEVDRTVGSVCDTHARNTGAAVPTGSKAEPLKITEKGNSQNKSEIQKNTATAEPSAATAEPAIQSDLHRVPGVLQSFVDYYSATAITQQPELAVQAALALGSTVAGRKYKTALLPNWSNLWFLSVAKSGAGKEHAKWCIEKALLEAEQGETINNGYTSKGAVFSMLSRQPSHIAIIDELGRYLEAAQDRGHVHFKDGVTALMESWNRSDGVLRPPQHSDRALNEETRRNLAQPIANPCIALLGMTTPSTLFEAVGDGGVQDGFLGRFVMAISDIEGVDELRPMQDIEIPDPLIDWIQAAKQPVSAGNLAAFGSPHEPATPHIVPISDGAFQIFNECKRAEGELRRYAEQFGCEVLPNRMTQKAIRIALILAVSESPEQPIITPNLAQWAFDYARSCDQKMVDEIAAQLVKGPMGKLMETLRKYIEKGHKKGRTNREIHRAHGHHGKRQLAEALDLLKSGGRVYFGDVTPPGQPGRKREAWVFEGYVTDTNEG